MKNRIIIVLIATIINISLFAQTKKDSVRSYKNEFGVNLLPFVNMASESHNNRAIANIFYKRQLKQNWYGRASLIAFSNNRDQSANSTSIHGLPNSKLSIQYSENKFSPYLQYNLGIERRFGKGRVKQFAGIDLGFAHYQSTHTELYGIRDSIENNSPYSYNQAGQTTNNDSIVLKTQTTANSIIFTPFYGLQFNINKHFLFSAQAGASLSLTNATNNTLIDNQKTKTASYSYTNFDLDFSQVSCNFSICYRF